MNKVLSWLATPFVWYVKQLSQMPRWMLVILIIFYSVAGVFGWIMGG